MVDSYKMTTASLRVLFEEYEWAKSRTYGPEYIGCDEFRPSVSSQGIRSWNLLVSQAYDEITTREEIKALLPIYENLADRLTVRSRSVHLCPSLFSKCFSISCQCFHLHET
ncbi:unnamed protein product [Trichobilharzia szidati]|nr:unnamed protein product [Trichobilharzia szidati]